MIVEMNNVKIMPKENLHFTQNSPVCRATLEQMGDS